MKTDLEFGKISLHLFVQRWIRGVPRGFQSGYDVEQLKNSKQTTKFDRSVPRSYYCRFALCDRISRPSGHHLIRIQTDVAQNFSHRSVVNALMIDVIIIFIH